MNRALGRRLKRVLNQLESNSENKWLKWSHLTISFTTLLVVSFAFWYPNCRIDDRANVSIVGLYRAGLWELEDDAIVGFNTLISNSGTTPVAILQVSWVLSQYPDPLRRDQRKVRWTYSPDEPLLVERESVEVYEFMIPSYEDTLSSIKKFREAGRVVFLDVPDVLRREPNFCVTYFSSVVVSSVDVKGRLHSTTLPLGTFGFRAMDPDGGIGVEFGDENNLPVKASLLPSRVLSEPADQRWVWRPAHMYNFDFYGPNVEADTTGWRFYLPHVEEVFREWVDGGGAIKNMH